LTEHADIHHNPCIIASGIVDNYDSSNFTFTLNPSQYINLSHTVLHCDIFCFFNPDSKKWRSKKPMPTTGSVTSVVGILTKIKRGFERKRTFQLELDNVAFLTPNRSSGTSGPTSQCMSPFLLSKLPLNSIINLQFLQFLRLPPTPADSTTTLTPPLLYLLLPH
jgi:hypothetical protein